MGIMLPDELIWILDKLGLEWPDIDEDEVYKAADLTRTFRDDLELLVQMADRRVVVDVAAGVQSRAGDAYISAWNTQRSQNIQKLLDVLDPVAFGIDGAGHLVVGLKVKFMAQLAWELATLLPLLALGPLGAGAAVAKMVATRFAMGVMIDLAVSGLIELVDDPVINVLKEEVPGVVQAMLDAPIVEDTGADLGQIYIDLEVLDQADADMTQSAGDVELLVTTYMSDLAALNISGD